MNGKLFNGIEILKEINENGNFASAALKLNVSTSAISQTIKNLEQDLGIAILYRTTRSVGLTEIGKILLNETSQAISQINRTIEQIKTMTSTPSGTLRLNMPLIIYKTHMKSIIESFQEKYPQINIEIAFESGKSDIVKEGFDAGIRISDILIQDMIAIKLFGPIKFVIAASSDYIKKFGKPSHPKELINHRCIVPKFGEKNLYDHWDFIEKNKEIKIKVNPYMILNNSVATIDECISGKGIMYVMKNAITDDVNEKKLEILLEDFACFSEGFFLYYPSKLQVLPKLRAFIDHVKTFLK